MNSSQHPASLETDASNEAKESLNYLTVNVWGYSTHTGHTSLAVVSEKGLNYLSYWPGALAIDNSATLAEFHTYEQDCASEGRIHNIDFKQPDGIYRLDLTKQEANTVFDAVEQIKEEAKKGEIRYYLRNQSAKGSMTTTLVPDERNYNCSGIIERVLHEKLNINFSDSEDSYPNRLAFRMANMKNVIPITHDNNLFGELPKDNLMTPRPYL